MRSSVLLSAVWLSEVSLTSLCHASVSEDISEYSVDTHPFNVDTFGVIASFIPGKEWDSLIQVSRGFRDAFQHYLGQVVHHSLPTSLFHTCSKDNVMHRMLSIPGSWLCSVPRIPDVMQYVPNMPAEIVGEPSRAEWIQPSSVCSAINIWRHNVAVSGAHHPWRPVQVTNQHKNLNVDYPGTESMNLVHWLNQDLFMAFSVNDRTMACVGSADHSEHGLCWIQVDSEEEAQPLAEHSKISFHQLISEGWIPGRDNTCQWIHQKSKLYALVI